MNVDSSFFIYTPKTGNNSNVPQTGKWINNCCIAIQWYTTQQFMEHR